MGDFNARFGTCRSDDLDDVIGTFGESGNLLIRSLQNYNLMICNGRTLLSDSQWSRDQNCFNH